VTRRLIDLPNDAIAAELGVHSDVVDRVLDRAPGRAGSRTRRHPQVTVRRREPAATFPRGHERANVLGHTQDARAVGGARRRVRANE
jgi:hypothetical protein